MRNEVSPIGLSVVMPLHGSAPYLEEAFESISFQGVEENYELLIVLDKTSRNLAGFPDLVAKNVRFIESEHSGVAHAHNAGIKSARFDIVAIAHSDDIYSPSRLSRQLKFLRSHPEIVGVGTQIDLIDEEGVIVGHGNYPIHPGTVEWAMRYKSVIAHPTAMYRKSIAISVGGYRQEFAPAEDFDLWRRMIQVGPFANLATTEIRYRLHKGQTSSTQIRLSSQKKAQVIVSGLDSPMSQPKILKSIQRLRVLHITLNDSIMMSYATFARTNHKFRAYLYLSMLIGLFPIKTVIHVLLYVKTKKEVLVAQSSISSTN